MNELIEIEAKEIAEISTNAVFEIRNDSDLARILDWGKKARLLIKKIEDELNPDIDKANKLHKSLVAKKNQYVDPVKKFKKSCDDSLITYNTKLEEEQRERERLANEELAKVAETNKQKLLDESKATENEWEKEILAEKANEIKPVTVDVANKVIEQEGLSIPKTWKARIVDFDLIPREYLIANEPLLNAVAKDFKGQLKVPGVEFYQAASVRVRS